MSDLRSDIKRAFGSWGFIAGIAGMAVAILIGCSGDIVSIMQSENDILPYGYHADMLFTALNSDVMLLCVPILSALPYTAAFVDDYKSGYIKEYLPRSGKERYIKGKVFATGLSGGLVLFIGIMAIYIVFMFVFTPMEAVLEEGMVQQSMFAGVLGKACLFFLCGCLWSLAGALLASVTMSKYMAYASPFIIYYVLVILCERYIKNVHILNPQGWLTAPEYWPGGGWGIALFLVELIAIISLGFSISVSRRLNDA